MKGEDDCKMPVSLYKPIEIKLYSVLLCIRDLFFEIDMLKEGSRR